MFDPTSRYANLPVATLALVDAKGRRRDVTYARRRFLPARTAVPVLAQHAVIQGDRLDNVTARFLGDPLQFWRVCDANQAMNPDHLLVPGRTLVIPVPQA